MALTPVLPKNRPDHPSLDYEVLRAEGIRHLENLATELWTDFNAHDPGITFLELLSYAITDLGYRTRKLPIADLLAGGKEKAFFDAVEILPCAPVTARDFRKILIDVEGVKNAWVEKYTGSVLFRHKGTDYGLFYPGTGTVVTTTGTATRTATGAPKAPELEPLDKIVSNDLISLNGLVQVILDLDDAIDPENESQTRPIVERAMKRLQANRLLGHDYLESPVIVGKLPVAICLHLEVQAGVNAAEAAAEALWQIEQHLTPTLRFHTFKEMRAKGYASDEIYNGPLLNHGFLDNKEVDGAKLRTVVRHSDLTNVATVHPHVIHVLELKVKVYPDDQFRVKTEYRIFTPDATNQSDTNPANLSRPLKPVIDLCGSCVYVTQNGVRREIREEVLADALNLKRLLAESHDTPGGPELPTGVFRPDLSEYRSIQYDLPSVYGVGDNDVSLQAPGEKKAAQRQLQAYLAFFDQILAAYLLQLGELRRLFAVEQNPALPTYQTANLSDIPGMKEIILSNGFSVEDQATREERRNRLMNHLLARFGEAFSAYAANLASASFSAGNGNFHDDFSEFLQSKADFLRNLPDLGYGRNLGYNYRGGKEKKVWNTANVAGIKKRVHSLLGLKGSWNQQSLLTKPAYRLDIVHVAGKQGVKQFQIVFKVLSENLPADADIPLGGVLLRSPRFTSLKAAQSKRDDLYSFIWDLNDYNLDAHPRESEQHTVVFKVEGKTELYGEPQSELEAKSLLGYIKELVDYETGSNKEGFHVLEHILLRPNDPADKILTISLGCRTDTHLADPYSGWLTVVLPDWSEKFADPAFQSHFEQVFRREMPADLAARFCRLNKDDMREFEERYMAWLEAKANCTPDECHITVTANALIGWLNSNPCSCSCSFFDSSDKVC